VDGVVDDVDGLSDGDGIVVDDDNDDDDDDVLVLLLFAAGLMIYPDKYKREQKVCGQKDKL